MILPDNNVSILMVRNAIGCPSTDLGTLVAKAKIGGKSGYAFNIAENGGSDGLLIEGAEPYWNLYSRKSAGEWILPELNYNNVYNRLLRDASGKYKFSLGAFCGYNHEARTVGHVFYSTDAQQYEGTQNKKRIGFMPTVVLGGYDWRIKTSDGRFQASKVAAVIDCTPIGGIIYESPKVELSGQESITFDMMYFEVDTSKIRSYELPSKIALYSSTDDLLGYLPGEGIINIDITGGPIIGQIYVDINSQRNIYTLVGSIRKGSSSLYGTFRYNAVLDDNPEVERPLKKIDYQAVNRETGVVSRTLSVTSGFRDDELPKRVYREETQFSVTTTRLIPSSSEYLRAIMYY